MKSDIQSITATQAFVPGIWVLASVEIAFDCNSSNGSPQTRSMFFGIDELKLCGWVMKSGASKLGGL